MANSGSAVAALAQAIIVLFLRKQDVATLISCAPRTHQSSQAPFKLMTMGIELVTVARSRTRLNPTSARLHAPIRSRTVTSRAWTAGGRVQSARVACRGNHRVIATQASPSGVVSVTGRQTRSNNGTATKGANTQTSRTIRSGASRGGTGTQMLYTPMTSVRTIHRHM